VQQEERPIVRKLATGLTAAFMVATVAASVMATKPDPDHKVTICHRTASDTNPFIIIEV
jgi:hypothetical protein